MSILEMTELGADPDPGSASKFFLKTNGNLVVVPSSGPTREYAPSTAIPVYGSIREYSEVDTFQSTGNDISVNTIAHTFTTPALPAGKYSLEWYYVWTNSSAADDFQGAVRFDSARVDVSPTGTPSNVDHIAEPKDSAGAGDNGTNQRYRSFGFKDIDIATGGSTHTLDLIFGSSGGVAGVHLSRFKILRVA